ncbi:MAG: rhomboid family protein [Candidatus Hydrogenedens sp.]|nr:rhomboid family protein [Candidatus Hydrogenedens sp.]
MNEALTQKRCFNHGTREAAARCPACERYFCRECVTEHEGQVLCVSCLAKAAPENTAQRGSRLGGVVLLLQSVAAIVVLWMVFFGLGRMMLSIPNEYHESVVTQPYYIEDE